jgi:succinate dehydrogenase/fumarate reductase cytochrome b subunit
MKLTTRGIVIITANATALLYTMALMLHHVLFDLAEYEAPHYPAWQLAIVSVTMLVLTVYIWALAWDKHVTE